MQLLGLWYRTRHVCSIWKGIQGPPPAQRTMVATAACDRVGSSAVSKAEQPHRTYRNYILQYQHDSGFFPDVKLADDATGVTSSTIHDELFDPRQTPVYGDCLLDSCQVRTEAISVDLRIEVNQDTPTSRRLLCTGPENHCDRCRYVRFRSPSSMKQIQCMAYRLQLQLMGFLTGRFYGFWNDVVCHVKVKMKK